MTRPVQSPKQDPQVRDLTAAELDHVTGGGQTPHVGGLNILLGDGSVRNFVDAGDYAIWRSRYGTGG